jgi:nickel/cobalt exporter
MRPAQWVSMVALAALVSKAMAHPVPKSNHDRTIVVRLQRGAQPERVVVHVDYRLEVDETTVLLEDMLPFKDEVDLTRYRGKPLEYYAEFTRIYAPILANHLAVKLDGQPVTVRCARRSARLVDEQGQPLGHLRCDFVFRAEVEIAGARPSALSFREGNYELQEGQILVSFANEAGLEVASVQAPDEALQKRPVTEQRPGDDDRLREVRVTFHSGDTTVSAPAQEVPRAEQAEPARAAAPEADEAAASIFRDDDSLLWLMASDYGFWLKMLLATVFGAAHALTPGHGKTLVAAYLIGQRGTVWHAVMLGVVTTITHTGAVLILAGVLFFLPDHLRAGLAASLQQGLGLAAGIMVICLGAWLLLQRLSGRADHVHLGGGHDHSHGSGHAHSHSHGLAATSGATGVRWWGLVVLGVTGGLVPCWDAILLFLYFVGRGEFWLVLPALVCFSAGLASVLVLIGVLVVQVPKFAGSRLGEGRVVQALPIVSASVIVLMGFWLCWKGVGGG